MDYKEHIGYALKYIEANLKNKIITDELASIAGYSKYHFLRVFKEATKLTPADYIRKRRLSEIAREIMRSTRPVSDIAFEYGFNSKENFTRAFKAEHHVLPTEYKSTGNSLKLYDGINFDPVPFAGLPHKIVELDSFSITAYPSTEKYPPHFWNIYNCKKLSRRLSGGKSCYDFGVGYLEIKSRRYDYFIGINSDEAVGDISGTVNIVIPEGIYAVFKTPPSTHFDFVNTVHRTWQYIDSVWFPTSGYIGAGGYEFETYKEDSRIFSEEIYIPLCAHEKSEIKL